MPSRSIQKTVKPAAEAPPPAVDLLDLGEPAPAAATAMAVDPFQQLESLLAPAATPGDDLLAGIQVDPAVPAAKKGPNLRESLEKDALQRQMGVVPSMQNPNLFSDLLG